VGVESKDAEVDLKRNDVRVEKVRQTVSYAAALGCAQPPGNIIFIG